MKRCDIDIAEFDKELKELADYEILDSALYWYYLPAEHNGKKLAGRKITVKKTGKTVEFFVKGVGKVDPMEKYNDICLGGFKRNYSRCIGKGSYLITTEPIPRKRLSAEVRNKYYNIVKKMGMVSPHTTKNMFMKHINVVNLDTASILFLYTTVSIIRLQREERAFVEKLVWLVDKGIDPVAAFIAATGWVRQSAHHIVRRHYAFNHLDNKSDAEVSLNYIFGIYKLLKCGKHKDLTPVNKERAILFTVNDTLKCDHVINHKPVKVKHMLPYANTLAQSIKIAANRNNPAPVLRLINKIENIEKDK